MSTKITAIHERVDDIPVIIAQLKRMRVAELLDKHFPTNGNWTGLSLGWVTVVWLTFIISEGTIGSLISSRGSESINGRSGAASAEKSCRAIAPTIGSQPCWIT